MNSLLRATIAAAEKHENARPVPTKAVAKILGSMSMTISISGPSVAPLNAAAAISIFTLLPSLDGRGGV
eukprot:Gb_19609 [translate_table: standard]